MELRSQIHSLGTCTVECVYLERTVLLLDPRLFIIQVPEELMQAVGLVELGAATGGHALDLREAAVDSVTLFLHLRGVEGVAGHQAVSLAIQVLQAILQGGADG